MQGQWFLGRDGQQYGPYSWDELRFHAAQGLVAGDDLVWAAHLPGWAPAKRIQGLMPEKRPPAAPPLTPPPAPWQAP